MKKAITLKDENGNLIYPCPYYPVGAIYMSVTNHNPATIFGGQWEQIQDVFLLGCGAIYKNGSKGGEASHQLTVSEMPKHNHWTREIAPGLYAGWGNKSHDGWITQALYQNNGGTWDTDYSGGNAKHNNMPPYLAVYIWKRIA